MEISAEDVISAFNRSQGTNFRYQVSVQKEQLRPTRRVDSINENCSELTEDQRKEFIAFCERWGGVCRSTYTEC